ncbi:ABC transporter substrate-binding protein [Kiloniella laminariae]|uniref:ABC transporter substrate-binding protein n=1 Tax=Kiloniella laminariae TaxID=454162 RepID=A0ABT4LFT4_9PROT|nr:ABC transporter substrate-binding protein [Kiloniella laminariae]MCZ4279966.1 ABC transporter substrate-binding protein [Kiloniella laminariae]
MTRPAKQYILRMIPEAQLIASLCTVVFFLLLHGVAISAEAISPEGEIKLGMSTALSGPAADLGQNMYLGVRIGLAEQNEKGGIQGKKLRLVALDDGYEPVRTVPNIHGLISEEKVLAIIGNVGTPTAIAALPIVNDAKVLFFAPFTGAGGLRRTPPDRYVINYRASYAQETSAMVEALIEHGGVKPEEVAFFTQWDSYGDAGYVGGIAALMQHGLSSPSAITHARYERNTLAVENALADILLANPRPKAVIIVGAYAPSARFIHLARDAGIKALFLNVSFVGSGSLARELTEEPMAIHEYMQEGEKASLLTTFDIKHDDSVDYSRGVIVTQVVPHPKDLLVPVVRAYHKALAEHAPGIPESFGSLEGYIAARIFIKALESLKEEPTRDNIVDALEKLGRFDIGTGHTLYFDPQQHQASHEIWPTVFVDGEFVPFDWSQISSFLPR